MYYEANEYTFPEFQINSVAPLIIHELDKLCTNMENDGMQDVIDEALLANTTISYFANSLITGVACLAVFIGIPAITAACVGAFAFFNISNLIFRKSVAHYYKFFQREFSKILTEYSKFLKDTKELISYDQANNLHKYFQKEENEYPYNISSEGNSKLPIKFYIQSDNIDIEYSIHLDSFVTRAFELAYHIAQMGYPGFEEDIINLYSIIDLYSKNKVEDTLSSEIQNKIYDKFNVYEAKCISYSHQYDNFLIKQLTKR